MNKGGTPSMAKPTTLTGPSENQVQQSEEGGRQQQEGTRPIRPFRATVAEEFHWLHVDAPNHLPYSVNRLPLEMIPVAWRAVNSGGPSCCP